MEKGTGKFDLKDVVYMITQADHGSTPPLYTIIKLINAVGDITRQVTHCM